MTRKYELLVEIASGENASMQNLGELCAIDFDTAFETYEYAILRGNTEIISSGLELFLKQSEMKTKSLFYDNAQLQKLIFTSAKVMDKVVMNFLAGLVNSNKLDTAGECMTKMRGTTAVDFGDAMRYLVDCVFAQSCAKNGTHIPTLNTKQKALLCDHIEKIKGPNRALLLQRMKEI